MSGAEGLTVVLEQQDVEVWARDWSGQGTSGASVTAGADASVLNSRMGSDKGDKGFSTSALNQLKH